MSDIDTILEKLITEPRFGPALLRDPGSALAGYELTADDLDVLAARLSTDAGGSAPVEARTSKAALLSVLSQFAGVAGVDPAATAPLAAPPMEALDHTGPYDDHDGDGLGFVAELLYGTNPENPDTDGDGLSDGFEAGFTDPADADTDGDGLSDGEELKFGSDPNKYDTDGEGFSDKEEFDAGSDPHNKDTDGDGLSDDLESAFGSDPTVPDTDGDGLSDWDEAWTSQTDPNNVDTDGDGAPDGFEMKYGADPNDPDSAPFMDHAILVASTDGGSGIDPDLISLRVDTLPSGAEAVDAGAAPSAGPAPDLPGVREGFNPQPDPPEEPALVAAEVDTSPDAAPAPDLPGVREGFNPQPDPPEEPDAVDADIKAVGHHEPSGDDSVDVDNPRTEV